MYVVEGLGKRGGLYTFVMGGGKPGGKLTMKSLVFGNTEKKGPCTVLPIATVNPP